MSKPTIGFIGLGLMGAAMVGRLQDQGYAVTVIANRSREAVDRALARGATEAQTARELAAASDVVMLCVATSEQVEGRMRGPDGVIAGLRDGAVVVDFGTSIPSSTKALGAEVAAAGGAYLDSPIGRTPQHAEQGLLNLMASGDKDAWDKVKPVLDDLGENVFHLGALGSGHAIKLINNFVAQAMANAMAEGFAMADKAGIGRKDLYDVMAAGPVRSGIMDFVATYAIEGKSEQMAFSIKNAAKDVGYYNQMTKDEGLNSIMSDAPLSALRAAMDAGMEEDFVPVIVDYYTKHFGL